MIPYFQLDTLHLGPLPIHTFGLLMFLGFWLGTRLAGRAAERTLGPGAARPLERAGVWALGCGLVGAHLMHVLGYHPELLREEGLWSLLKVWEGFSSVGGLLGGLLGLWLSLRKDGVRLGPYLNALALGAAPGWAVARLGCFLVHDHPGVRTRFPLAVAFPDGPRHDLGLDDMLVLALLTALLYALRGRLARPGALAGLLAVGYGAARFGLDFLRATDLPGSDARILGLTPAQYVALALVPVGLWLLGRGDRPAWLPPAEAGGHA